MAKDIFGTPKSVTVDNLNFRVMADANIEATPSSYENKPMATSGDALRVMTKRVETREGLTIACNSNEADLLRAIADSPDNVPLSYTLISGDTFRAVGFIEFEKWESESGKGTLKMFPVGEWKPFLV